MQSLKLEKWFAVANPTSHGYAGQALWRTSFGFWIEERNGVNVKMGNIWNFVLLRHRTQRLSNFGIGVKFPLWHGYISVMDIL